MRRFLTVACLLLVNFVIQSSLFQFIEINMIKPNTSLIIIISYAILRGDVEGAIVGFCAGLLQDMFFGRYIGLYALLGLLVGYFCGKPFKDFYSENYMLPVFLTAIGSLLYEFCFYITNYFFRARFDLPFYFYRLILPSAVYNLVLCIPIYMIVYFMNKKLEEIERTTSTMF